MKELVMETAELVIIMGSIVIPLVVVNLSLVPMIQKMARDEMVIRIQELNVKIDDKINDKNDKIDDKIDGLKDQVGKVNERIAKLEGQTENAKIEGKVEGIDHGQKKIDIIFEDLLEIAAKNGNVTKDDIGKVAEKINL